MQLFKHSKKSLLRLINSGFVPEPDRSALERPWRYHVAEWTKVHAKVHPLIEESKNAKVAA